MPSLSEVPPKQQLQAFKQYYIELKLEPIEVIRNLAQVVHVKFEGKDEVYCYCRDTLLGRDTLIRVDGVDYEPKALFQEFYSAEKKSHIARERLRASEEELIHLDRYAVQEPVDGESFALSGSLLEPRIDVLIREIVNWLDGLDPILSYGKGIVPNWGSTAAIYHEGTDEFTYSRPSQEKIATEDRQATALRFTKLFDLPNDLRVCWEKIDEETVNVNGWATRRPVHRYQVRHWNSREQSLLYNGGEIVDGADPAGYRSVEDLFKFLCHSGLIPIATTILDFVDGSDSSQDISQQGQFLLSDLERWRYRLSEDELLMRARFEYVRRGFPLEQYELFLPFVAKS